MSANSYNVDYICLLGIAFVILKLCHVINWSWWLVLLPFWGGFALAILILIGIKIFFRR